MIIMRGIKILFAVTLIASIGGCLSLIKEPDPITIYALQADHSQPKNWPSVTWPLTIIRPNSSSFLDSNRIAVRPNPNVLQVYKGANWSDSLPDLVQAHLVEKFESSEKIKTVSRQNSGVPADVALLLDIRQFESVYANGQKNPHVLIQIHAKLLEYPSNRVITSRTFITDIPSTNKHLPAVVEAFEIGLNVISQDIVGWTLANGKHK
jgi:cholesterol transport system auxiliary component